MKAITETLQTIFVPRPDHLQNKSTKRTLIRQSSGQVMTEEKVIEQLAKQNQKKNSKQSGSKDGTTMSKKRRKTNSDGIEIYILISKVDKFI